MEVGGLKEERRREIEDWHWKTIYTWNRELKPGPASGERLAANGKRAMITGLLGMMPGAGV